MDSKKEQGIAPIIFLVFCVITILVVGAAMSIYNTMQGGV